MAEVTREDREFAAYGRRRDAGMYRWIETGETKQLYGKNEKMGLPFIAQRVADFREKSVSNAIRAMAEDDKRAEFARRVRADTCDEILEKIRQLLTFQKV